MRGHNLCFYLEIRKISQELLLNNPISSFLSFVNYCKNSKYWGRKVGAYSVDLDQTAPLGAV